MNSTRQQNRARHIEIVRHFCQEMADDQQCLLCFLLSREVPEREICWRMGIRMKTLRQLKLQIAVGLRLAGVRLYGEEVL